VSPAPPAWLEAFQAGFGRCLAEPLDDAGGTWRARPERYPEALRAEALPGPELDASERLAVYNRQYWFRLYGALQGDYPLVARLLGAWTFNQGARDFLVLHPPRTPDIQAVGAGFGSFLLAGLGRDRGPLAEAVAIDEAVRHALLAPEEARLALGAFRGEAPLRRASAWTLLEEHWPLVDLRGRPDPGEAAVPLPPRLAAPQAWAIGGQGGAVGFLRLEPLQAALLRLAHQLPLAEALAELEAACPAEEREALAGRVQRWLRLGVRLGLWAAPG